jgi:CRP-like cAMP-binding protein
VSLTAACNGRHTLAERLAKWLLMAHDRATGDLLPRSHEFLAEMLCVRRAGVTVALRTLRAANLVRNTHGRVTIVDREGLEAVLASVTAPSGTNTSVCSRRSAYPRSL